MKKIEEYEELIISLKIQIEEAKKNEVALIEKL